MRRPSFEPRPGPAWAGWATPVGFALIAALLVAPIPEAHGSERPPTRRPSVLLILPDQWRGQDLGCMGNPDVRTPNLDRLASEGVLFRNTFANTPVCCPARANHPHRQVRPPQRHGRQRPAAAGVGDDARRDPGRPGIPDRLHRQVAPRRRQAAARVRPARPAAAGVRLLGRQRVRPPALPAHLFPRRRPADHRGSVRARGLDRPGHRVPQAGRGGPLLPGRLDGAAPRPLRGARAVP